MPIAIDMGGGAFAQAYAKGEPTLKISRLQPEEYQNLKTIYLEKLQAYFPQGTVACLKEAPQKIDYGDIDIFVAIDQRVDFIDLANYLGATGVICYHGAGHPRCTIGVTLDGGTYTRPTVLYKSVHEGESGLLSSTVTVDDYAQIDIEIIPPELCEWHSFYSSYSDMAGLLGHVVTNLGFSVTDRGLLLRLQELDDSKKIANVNIADRDGKILLTNDPDLVMQFLGLSLHDYKQGFDTVAELYEWLGKCRLLSAQAIKIKRNNSHERNREAKRTIYSKFFNEWLPERLEFEDIEPEEQKQIVRSLRSRYCQEAIDFFGKQAEHKQKQQALSCVIGNAKATELLRPIISQCSGRTGKSLNDTIRAFRRHVGFDDQRQPRVLETPHSDDESQLYHFLAEDNESLRSLSDTTAWVGEHCDELRGRERKTSKGYGGGMGTGQKSSEL